MSAMWIMGEKKEREKQTSKFSNVYSNKDYEGLWRAWNSWYFDKNADVIDGSLYLYLN